MLHVTRAGPVTSARRLSSPSAVHRFARGNSGERHAAADI